MSKTFGRSLSVLFLTSGRNTPSSIYYIEQFLSSFKSAGIAVRVLPCIPEKYISRKDFFQLGLPLMSKIISRTLGIMQSIFYDVVFIERELIPYLAPLPEAFVRVLNHRIVFLIDDGIHLNFPLGYKTIGTVLRLARHVIAGSPYLADYVRCYNSRVTIIPTPIDTNLYFPADKKGSKCVTLLWTGTPSTLPYLIAKQNMLDIILKKYPQSELMIHTAPTRKLSALHIPYTFVEWSRKSDSEVLKEVDVGLAPYPDDEWCRCKSGLKVIKYMAAGIPCVASPVGILKDLLREAGGGFLATTEQEWLQSLSRLIEDEDLRRQLGEQGRRAVVERYSVQATFPILLKILYDVAGYPMR